MKEPLTRRAELIVHHIHKQWRESYASDVQAQLAEGKRKAAGGTEEPGSRTAPPPWHAISNKFFR